MSIPFISDVEIEQHAVVFREKALQAGVSPNFPFQVEHALEVLHNYEVTYGADDLPDNVFGSTDPDSKTIRISSRCFNTAHELFTVAHEAGHVVLHEKLLLARKQAVSLFDLEPVPLQAKPLESQANKFASAILIPKVELLARFDNHLKQDLPIELREVMSQFKISRLAAEIRLVALGLINTASPGTNLGI
jgi:Zn-dependent peptidase ImmA (M78 family)